MPKADQATSELLSTPVCRRYDRFHAYDTAYDIASICSARRRAKIQQHVTA